MLHDQIVGCAAVEGITDIIQPFVGKAYIHGVHNGDLVIKNGVRVIGHTVRNNILSLKEIHLMVVDTDIANIRGDLHGFMLLFISLFSRDRVDFDLLYYTI